MWKSFENIGVQTSEKVSWEKKKHAQNIRSTVHRTGDLTSIQALLCVDHFSFFSLFGSNSFYLESIPEATPNADALACLYLGPQVSFTSISWIRAC